MPSAPGRDSTPGERHSGPFVRDSKKISHGTTPTAHGVRFFGPGGRRHALGPSAMRGRFTVAPMRTNPAVSLCSSSVRPLFVPCATTARGPNHRPRNPRNETHSRPPRGPTIRNAAPTPGAVSGKVTPQRPLHIANAFSSNSMDKLPSTFFRTPRPQRQEAPSFRRAPLLSHGAAWGHRERIASVLSRTRHLQRHEERSRPSRLRPSPSSNRSNTLNRYPLRPCHAGGHPPLSQENANTS